MSKITINFPNATAAQLAGATVEGGGSNGGATPPPPPTGNVTVYPAGAATNNGTRFPSATKLKQGDYYAFGNRGKKKLSWAISSGGYPCYAGFDLNNMGGAHTGGVPWQNSPDGDWVYYVMYTADPGREQDAHIDMLDA